MDMKNAETSASGEKETDAQLLGSVQRFSLAEAKDEGLYRRGDKGAYEHEHENEKESSPVTPLASSPGRTKWAESPAPDTVSGNTGRIAASPALHRMALGLRIEEMRMRDCVNNKELWHSTAFDDQDDDSQRGVQVRQPSCVAAAGWRLMRAVRTTPKGVCRVRLF